jgi:rhomboid protease GluP
MLTDVMLNQPENTQSLPRKPIATYTLIAINVIIFLLTIGQNSYLWGGNNHYFTLEQGEYYRLIVSMFLHANLIHIAFNMLALYSIGHTLEGFIGTPCFLIVYFLGGLAGSVMSMTLNTSSISSVGASGAVVAIFSAEIAFIYSHRGLFGENAGKALQRAGTTILLNLFIGLSPDSGIDNWAHLGGFIGGIVVYLALNHFFIAIRPQVFESGYVVSYLEIRNKQALMAVGTILVVFILYFMTSADILITTRTYTDGNVSVQVPRSWVMVTSLMTKLSVSKTILNV